MPHTLKVDDVISISSSLQNNKEVLEALEEKDNRTLLPFLNREGMSGKLVRLPKRGDIEVLFDLQPIIEYYSR